MVECGTGNQVGADDIDAEDVNPSVGISLGEWLKETEAGDVHNQIEAAHPLGRGGDHRSHGLGFGGVGSDRIASAPAGDERIELVLAACRDRDARTGLDRCLPERGTDPGGSADDQDPSSGQCVVHVVTFPLVAGLCRPIVAPARRPDPSSALLL